MIPAGLLKKFSTDLLLLAALSAHATDKLLVVSGNWSNPATWGGTLPVQSEKVVVLSGMTLTIDLPVTVNEVTVSQGATLTWSNASTLIISSKLIVDGTVLMNGGNIAL